MKLSALLPLAASLALIALLGRGLQRDAQAEVPSPLVGKPAPALDLERLDATAAAGEPLKGQVWVLNVFASWCAPCRAELPVLGQLTEQSGVRVVGLDYKDTPELGQAFLKRHGNPYAFTWRDPEGKGSLAWGVTGVPETFVIDRKGVVRLRHTGPVTTEDLNKRLLPLIKKLQSA